MDVLIFGAYELAVSFLPFLILMIMYIIKQKQDRKGISVSHVVAVTLFALYIIGVYYVTEAGTLYDVIYYRLKTATVHIEPFSCEIDLMGYFLNVVMLVPFGILVPYIWEELDNPLAITVSGALFSVFVEMTQMLNYRATDIDDVLMNALGALTGYYLYNKCRELRSRPCRKNDMSFGILIMAVLATFAGRFFLYDEIWLADIIYAI